MSIFSNTATAGLTAATFASMAAMTTATASTMMNIVTMPQGNYFVVNGSSTTTGVAWNDASMVVKEMPDAVQLGEEVDLELPDGSRLVVDKSGSFHIEDKDAKVTYRANRVRDFNRYLNASDLLADFIRDLGVAGARQDQVLQVPVETFINWMVHKAAEADGDPVPTDVPRIEAQAAIIARPRCNCCGRWIPRRHVAIGLSFCSGAHADEFLTREPK